MYCVNCGVKLEEGRTTCPLCQTEVWNPKGKCESHFSDKMPELVNFRLRCAVTFSSLAFISAAVILIVWLNVGIGKIWGGVVMLGIALLYISLVMPLWFKNYLPAVWVPLIHASASGYLLYVCSRTGGTWFVPFALPLLIALCLINTTTFVLLKHLKNKLLVLGGSTIAYGAFTILLEYLEHIVLGHRMFVWSVYSASGSLLVGVFLILIGLVKPFRNFWQKYLFF